MQRIRPVLGFHLRKISFSEQQPDVKDDIRATDVTDPLDREKRMPQVVQDPERETQIEVPTMSGDRFINIHQTILETSGIEIQRIANKLRLLDVYWPCVDAQNILRSGVHCLKRPVPCITCDVQHSKTITPAQPEDSRPDEVSNASVAGNILRIYDDTIS